MSLCSVSKNSRPILQLVSVLMFADDTVVLLPAGHVLLCKGYRTLWLGIKPEENIFTLSIYIFEYHLL